MTSIRYLLIALALGLLAYLTLPNPVFAAAGAPGNNLGEIRVPAALVTLIVALLIPVATGALTKAHWPARAKDAITILLNAVNVLVVGAVISGGAAVLSFDTIFQWAITTITSIATYFRIWKPAGITSTPLEVNGTHIPGRLADVGVK